MPNYSELCKLEKKRHLLGQPEVYVPTHVYGKVGGQTPRVWFLIALTLQKLLTKMGGPGGGTGGKREKKQTFFFVLFAGKSYPVHIRRGVPRAFLSLGKN